MLIEHFRLLNIQGISKTHIHMEMIYAILAYNHSMHAIIKLKPIEIVNGLSVQITLSI